MQTISIDPPAGPRAGRLPSPLRALAAFEWLAHGRLITLAFVFWASFQWVLPFFIAPQFLLAFGLAYAALVASRVAGSDALEGTTELTLGLPFTRRQLYLVRASLAGLPLAAMLGVGLLALRFEWVQAVWGLIVESGFAEPFTSPGAEPDRFPWYGLSFALPILSFACTFVLAALASSPRAQPLLWFPGLIAAVVTVSLGLSVETGLWGERTGWIAVPLALVGAAIVLVGGAVRFERKDAPGDVGRGDARLWPMTLGLVAAVAVLVIGLLFAVAVVSNREAAIEAEHARQAAERARQAALERRQERIDAGEADGGPEPAIEEER